MVMGAGQVGRHAVEAATKYGSLERFAEWSRRGVPAVEVLVVGRGLTGNPGYMRERFAGVDVLVDASQRSASSRPLIQNEWLGWLPAHAVVCDLVVDPYVPSGVPPTVRSIEGIPCGSLDQYIFLPGDPGWSNTIPEGVPQAERRPTATCYSWPGIHPEDCMRHYGRQLRPLLERVVARGVAELREDGDFFDRALLRASLRSWSAGDQSDG
jgi:alanine dehydrogenase